MPDQPSWRSSTLSQAFMGSLIAYWGLLLIVTIGLLFFKADVEVAKLIVGWCSALEASIAAAYLAVYKSRNGEPNMKPPDVKP